ncbi:prephenate dehydratase [Paenibacillus macquariensis]|uniref:Prephenate dehydratase n=1 Tax=Paenibacillus macquariensis TaxID=948756 RepID=A0ABY1KDY7_9BACL|nr:prephenate dehydratase [Paenibacillus macquariensis]OAB29919.1 prephenate dehydratase [Paenibacillus macquariensis subsp. macquariensis]SIR68449.1 prephenate dehydratase [Paenibacillus macquariensis]
MKVAYLGPEGTFSEEAAIQYFNEDEVEYFMYDTIPDVIEAVGEYRVDKAIVPLENTIEGTINMTIDSLISFDKLLIEGEYTLPVSLHLLANKDTYLSEIKEVWSISPILTQCRKYIKKRSVKSLQYDSSASAATTLKNSERTDVAAIGSRSLANILSLNIIDWNIQDNLDNETRFIIISNNIITEIDSMKTMFVITPGKDQSGVLSSILNVFTALAINLSWIESRPTARKLGVYRFFLEANSNCSTMTIERAVTILETLGHEVRIIGRYNAFESKSMKSHDI